MLPTGMYAHAGINREVVEGDDDAACRVVYLGGARAFDGQRFYGLGRGGAVGAGREFARPPANARPCRVALRLPALHCLSFRNVQMRFAHGRNIVASGVPSPWLLRFPLACIHEKITTFGLWILT